MRWNRQATATTDCRRHRSSAVAAHAAPTGCDCRSCASCYHELTTATNTRCAGIAQPQPRRFSTLSSSAVAAHAAPTWSNCRSGVSCDHERTTATNTRYAGIAQPQPREIFAVIAAARSRRELRPRTHERDEHSMRWNRPAAAMTDFRRNRSSAVAARAAPTGCDCRSCASCDHELTTTMNTRCTGIAQPRLRHIFDVIAAARSRLATAEQRRPGGEGGCASTKPRAPGKKQSRGWRRGGGG
jgi:hypothetical protein